MSDESPVIGVGVERDREKPSKWWVVVNGHRVSDHVGSAAARQAAQGHLRPVRDTP